MVNHLHKLPNGAWVTDGVEPVIDTEHTVTYWHRNCPRPECGGRLLIDDYPCEGDAWTPGAGGQDYAECEQCGRLFEIDQAADDPYREPPEPRDDWR